MSAENGRWNTYFAADPKNVLQVITERWFKDREKVAWEKVFPLIHAAHAAAHPEIGEERDLKYLERLMDEALHDFSPKEFLTEKISASSYRILTAAASRQPIFPPTQAENVVPMEKAS
jgi:hypothetical protein